MNPEKDIVDLKREKEALEKKLKELDSKEELSPAEQVIKEEVIRDLQTVNGKIAIY
jgi:hypothetical protein